MARSTGGKPRALALLRAYRRQLESLQNIAPSLQHLQRGDRAHAQRMGQLAEAFELAEGQRLRAVVHAAAAPDALAE